MAAVYTVYTHGDCGPPALCQEAALDVDQALFQPFPSEVVFQQFEPHQTYQFPLALRNNDKVQLCVRGSIEPLAAHGYVPIPLHPLT